jgi:adenylate cyclase
MNSTAIPAIVIASPQSSLTMTASVPPPVQVRVDHARLDALREWMIDGAPPSAQASDIIKTMCDGLVSAGIPVDRFALFIFTLHPNIKGRAFYWRPGREVQLREADYETAQSPGFRNAIAVNVMETGNRYRCRFETEDVLPPFPDVREIRDEGMTDYLIEPLIFTTGETHAVSWATQAPGGFTDEQVAALERIRAPLARLTETYMLRLNAANLLSAYVGRGGGRRVLEGNVRRGDTEQISAAILFVDIKDFTRMSGSTPAETMIGRLNGFFDVFVAAIDEENGEVLKFMGDALLAIVPVGAKDTDEARAAAVARAREALARAENAFAEAPDKRVGYRAAIHVGEISYGNIGGGDRLDFTAIGPTVNLAARLLETAGRTGRDLVCSEQAAGCLTGCEALGEFDLKGIAAAQRVFAVPAPPAAG